MQEKQESNLNGAKNKEDDDEEMQDEEYCKEQEEKTSKEAVPMISLINETGELHIDEARFCLSEKPYAVRLLFKTYRECKDFIEQV